MKINFIIILALFMQFAAQAQLRIASGEDIYVSGTENLFTTESFSNAGKLTIAPGGTATLNGGSASGMGTIKGSSTSNLSIGGTSTNGTYYFDQTTLGTTNVLKDLTLSGTASVSLGNALNIVGGATPGKVIVASGTTLNTGGFLRLKSDINGTASIGPSFGTISGNVTVERYVTSSGRRFRFLSSPVQNNTIANWMSQFYVTGPCTTAPSVLGAINDQGWHSTFANIAAPGPYNASTNRFGVKYTSIRTYNESVAGSLNNGFTDVTPSMSLSAGKGFNAFIRGAIGDTGQLNGTVTGQSEVTLALTGAVNQGEINSGATFTSTSVITDDGWNLLGNPYPCAYDFNAQYDLNSSANFANINPTVYVLSALTGGYISYNALSNTSSGLSNGIIPSGAGFFIKANAANPVLKFQETFKTTSNATAVHKTEIKTDEFGIKYFKDSTESDYLVIKMFEGATLNSEIYDIVKYRNDNLNLAAYGEDTIDLAGSCIPFVSEETHIKLNVEANAVGTYQFEFTNMENFDANVSVSLLDKYTNKTSNVKANTKYSFEMGPGVNQWGKNRFELILNGKINTSINQANIIANTNLTVYPNPATDLLNINMSNASFKNSSITISSVSGQQLMNSTMNGANAAINIEGLSNGVYFVTVANENGFNKSIIFVK
jgi:hypothetical protein